METSGAFHVTSVRKISAADIPFLAEKLAASFASQPLSKWALGAGERALARGERILRLNFQNALPFNLGYTTAELDGAALWHPPGVRQSLWQAITWIIRLAGITGVSRRLIPQLSLFIKYEKTFPRNPHYYLSLLAVAPERQGKGIGSALLKPVLDRCDEEGMCAYTATDTMPNVRFYEKKGFRIKDTISMPGSGVTIRTMLRHPGGSQ